MFEKTDGIHACINTQYSIMYYFDNKKLIYKKFFFINLDLLHIKNYKSSSENVNILKTTLVYIIISKLP